MFEGQKLEFSANPVEDGLNLNQEDYKEYEK